MRKPSYDTLSKQLAVAEHQRWIDTLALGCVLHETPDATVVGMVEDLGDGRIVGGATYDYAVYRAHGAAGGILLRTFRYAGQKPSTTAHYYEEYARGSSLPYFDRLAINRLSTLIHRAFQAAHGLSS